LMSELGESANDHAAAHGHRELELPPFDRTLGYGD
jgi:hypothetical protein